MTPWAVLLSITLLLVLLISGKVKPAIAFVSLAAGYLLVGFIDTSTLLVQYTNPALATLLLLLLVSLALERSPLLDWLSQHLLKGHPKLATARLMGSTAVLSAFLNNTAVVAAFLGAITRQQGIAPSRLLIPLSYASILGGITTLVGTSTNLVVNSFNLNASGSELGMFQFSLVGIPVALITLAVLLWRANALPHHRPEDTEEKLSYFLAADVEAESPMIGKSIEQNGLRSLDGLYLLEIERQGRLISPVAPDEQLQADDTLVFTGEVSKVQALQRFPGLNLFGHQADNLLATNLVEVVISHESELAGKTLQDVDFRSMFSAGVVGIRRGDKRLEGQLGKIPLRVGDCLLLAVSADFRQHRNLDRNFHLLSGSFTRPQLNRKESLITLGGFATVISLAAANWLPLFHGLLILLGALLLLKVISMAELRRRFPFELWLIIGSALAIAQALENSGAAALLADGMQAVFSGYGIYAAFIGCYLLTLVLTETVTNNAAAALAFPIAWSTAHAFGADPLPFVMAVAYGASACFLIPFGYQTHLMVYSPGRYKITDFFKIGLPVSLTYSAAVLLMTPLVFPF
ncbi:MULTISPECIES: SLC13 family permease [unclassified Halomonas]|uniref:SLC13 family permease n=1 Tax=unclassified Halomonas TaxID=2609666 RepID=UPI001EF4390D|nr:MULTISPECIES: SLC13 family permease [unclassified Halomonas]MCG7577225.1 SLC13 family permease [Halomonas sp. MMH1-48]MCG7604290.1 SLC13 family permease [Halomonas sp. MM17-34]MCG7613539.1 SLC13 family permease [Halomonas sp. MM17-29]MCG7620313.1 SLC13 family permease [Halomonas sp. DSH1-27]